MPTTTAAPGTITTWNLDPKHSVAEFKVRHMMISHVKGTFSALSGTLQLDETDYTHSKIDASIAVSSVSPPNGDGCKTRGASYQGFCWPSWAGTLPDVAK